MNSWKRKSRVKEKH